MPCLLGASPFMPRIWVKGLGLATSFVTVSPCRVIIALIAGAVVTIMIAIVHIACKSRAAGR